LVIFAVGILGVATMQITSIKGNSKGRQISEAVTVGADQIETLLANDYGDWDDTDGDGTSQDNNHDGVDDNGGNFGLDDVTDATADGRIDTANGYVIFWNVAYNHKNNAIPSNLLGKENSGLKTVRFQIEKPGQVQRFSIDMVRVDL
ncbi:MAG: hypothetical protein B6I36_08145, partial [Desulfobacteraceae bacterium 4572_35.1]